MSGFYTSVERYGNTIFWRGYENGKRFSRKVQFQPTLFLSAKSETAYRALLGGGYLQPKRFEDMRAAKDFVEKYKEVEGFEICGNTNYEAQFIQENYPGVIDFNPEWINIFKFDIEVDISDGYADTELADKEITSIAFKSSKSDTYWLFGRKGYDRNKTITGIDPEKIMFVQFETEKAMLIKFIKHWTDNYPDIVTGWNVEFFDIQYIVTRIARLFGEDAAKKLSPHGYIRKRTKELFGKMQSTWIIMGVAVIDYMDAFKKFGYKYGPQESYKLDHIAHVVLGEKKLDYSEYGSLTELYEKNPQLYLDYNLKDTYLIQRMEEETALLELVMTVAYGGGVNYTEAFGTVGIWDTIIYRKLMSKGIVPFIKGSPGNELGELVGGFVKDPVIGKHSWLVSFDLNSLYPHLMLQYNMSPETFMRGVRKFVDQEMVLKGTFSNDEEYSVCANGACFRNDVLGIIPEIIEDIYKKRSDTKKAMLGVEREIEAIKEELAKRRIAENRTRNPDLTAKINKDGTVHYG